MYSILQTRYQRVERTLDGLLDSITAYNPSLAAADELAEADNQVNQALEQLSIHHTNYSRILSLRAASAALDSQLRSTLSALSTTRTTLKSISLPAPATTTPVTVGALLSYAKFISKTTVPPTSREAAKDTSTEQDGTKDEESGPATAETSEAMRRVLPPELKGQFVPWPGHDIIMHSGLTAVQGMKEAGGDPELVMGETKAEQQLVEDTKPSSAVEAAAPPPTVFEHARHKEEDEFDPDEM